MPGPLHPDSVTLESSEAKELEREKEKRCTGMPTKTIICGVSRTFLKIPSTFLLFLLDVAKFKHCGNLLMFPVNFFASKYSMQTSFGATKYILNTILGTLYFMVLHVFTSNSNK